MKGFNVGRAAIAGAAACVWAGAATAEEPTRTVSLAGVDFADAAQVEELYREIDAAARQVCRRPADRHLYQHADRVRCARATLEQAVADSGRLQLAAVHSERTGRAYALARVTERHAWIAAERLAFLPDAPKTLRLAAAR